MIDSERLSPPTLGGVGAGVLRLLAGATARRRTPPPNLPLKGEGFMALLSRDGFAFPREDVRQLGIAGMGQLVDPLVEDLTAAFVAAEQDFFHQP